MFKFDHAALPQLLLRKALIVVDFQNDFIAEGGALEAVEPEGFVDRTLKLAEAFHSTGDVVWVNSQYDEMRSADEEKIIASDTFVTAHAAAEGEAAGKEKVGLDALLDPEAFLSQKQPTCVEKSSPGQEMPISVLSAVEKKDAIFTKTHYSAFKETGLLRSLRAKMITEVYICGSLANIGVHATAIDAAGHGMTITVVEDCCGYRSEGRQSKAMKSLLEITGCDIMSAQAVRASFQPSTKRGKRSNMTLPAEILQPMSSLSLSHSSLPPVAHDGAAEGEAESEVRSEEHSPSHDTSPNIGEPTGKKHDNSIRRVKKGDLSRGHGDSTSQTEVRHTESSLATEEDTKLAAMAQHIDEEGHGAPEQQVSVLKGLCEGDTDIIENILPPDLADEVFEKLRHEIQWQRMSHQGGDVPRLVAVQGEVANDGSIPVYRHPSDESPPLLSFSPTVEAIKEATEQHLGHALNHVLIQFYRDGRDYISEHSDKTLDIVRGSYIANVSLGAQRTMVLRTKRPEKNTSDAVTAEEDKKRRVQRAPLPHNSLCRMGLQTNMKWLHSIRQDKRADREKSASELAYGTGRISLTFRQIGTFLSHDESQIWGQGATSKTRDGAKAVINGQCDEAIQMLRAFGTENHASAFDWDAHYGKGFDVLHLRSSPRLFASNDAVINMRIALMLSEHGINYAKGSMAPGKDVGASPTNGSFSVSPLIKFVDNKEDRPEVNGDVAIMLYLHACHPDKKSATTASDQAKQFTLFQKALSMLPTWRKTYKEETEQNRVKIAAVQLSEWDELLKVATATAPLIGGERPNLADFAFWPVLHNIVQSCGTEVVAHSASLKSYYHAMKERESTVKALRRDEAAKDSE